MGSGSLISAATKSTDSIEQSQVPQQAPRLVTRFVTKIARGKKLDLALANDSFVAGSIKKLLLLGAGGSGKSTIFKQMKVIYGLNYSEAEKKRIAPVIYSNILHSMKILIEQAIRMELIETIECKDEFKLIKGAYLDEGNEFDITVADAIKVLWKDPGMKIVWGRRREFQITESVQYYFNKIDVIKMPNYIPDKDDILYSRARTSGILTDRYSISGHMFEIYDVGGQRNERRKWIHCFEGVSAVIFVASISEFDQILFEDSTTNRMVEALNLFEDICNNKCFLKSNMILFLNMRDLFAIKIRTVNIKDVNEFSDYAGPSHSYVAGLEYFLAKFLAKNNMRSRQIYHHVTCATDTSNVRNVFDTCKDIIIKQNLKDSGFME